tara:strand:+ start:337 stop:1989 length:1653 start_codon:yes stop_codon:yes gene_type:complete
MALPSSGQISFADLQSEYGGTNPISISEFRGSRYNPTATDSGPGYQIYDVSYNSSNNKLAFNGTDADYLFLNNDEKIVMICESGVWNDGNLYFSSTTTPGNNNLLGTGVNAASVGVGQMMVLDGADAGFTSTTTGTLIGYLKSNNTTDSTAVRVYLVTDPGNTANQVNYLYGRCRFTFSDAGSFVGGSRLNLYPFLRSIDNIENGVILPNNRTFSWNQDMTALPTIWSGGTWHYIYFQVYDATWDNSTKTYSFSNFRNIAWTNNTSYTNGSGTYLGGSGQANNATNVANVLASTAGYNTARTPNYTGTSESINLTMSNSGTRLDGTMTNTTGNDILLYKYTMSNSTGFPAGSNNRLMSLAWADSSNAFTNSHTVNSTGCFNTFRRTHYGYPTWLRLQFYFTPAGSGTEADIGYFNFVFEDAVSQADALQFIKTQTEAFFHDPLDTGEDYPYLRATVNADSIDFHYYRQGILRVVPTYYRFGYNQGGSGGTAYPSTADSALQAHSNYNFATTKSNELNTFAKGNGNVKAQTLNMSLSDYYDGRGNLTLGSG